MNVLVCIPCLQLGGTEIQTLALVKALRCAGHQVRVVCYFEYSPEMVRTYEQTGAEVILLSNKGTRPSGVTNTLKFLFRGMRKALKGHKVDVAHVQYMAPGALPILILRALGIKNIIATAHTGADIYSSLKPIHFLCRHFLMGWQCITLLAEKSFFPQDDTEIFNGIIPPSKHFTIHNCLNEAETFAQLRQLPDCPTIGVVSRLESIKGMDLVVPAFAKIQKNIPGAKLLIVGDGSLQQTMQQQAGELNVEVEFAGRQPQDALGQYYSRINVVLMPSRSEGFGLSAIEGMSHGCVPVVANIGGLPEVVEHGKNGLLHAPEDIDNISDVVTNLLRDNSLYNKLSANAVARAREFSFDKYSEKITSLYRHIQSII